MKRIVLSEIKSYKFFTLVFASLLVSGFSFGQTVHYVATTGSDITGDGTLAKPYLTILKGIAAATTVNGDTIKVAPGTYTAAATTTVSKSIAIVGTGATASDVILNRGSYATSAITGFTITANNVTIRNLKVTNYNAGIGNTVAISNLTLDNVQLIENWGAGFYSTLSLDSLAIINSMISYNGNKTGTLSNSTLKRGIYLLTGGFYAKIRFDNNTIDYNGTTGIEISSVNLTTSIDGITISNNKVRNNSDAQISTWLGTANPTKKGILISNNTVVLSDTSRYGIEIRNPAGNGKTSGAGSVVVSNNTISVVTHTGNSRDMAAIAVTRRKETGALATINDQPQGVVVSGNTISDFQNPKLGKAFGIVCGGTGHKVFGNIISNTEFSIQLQRGNTNFATNVATPDIPNQVNTAYFDRDNSKDACVEIGSNTITTSGQVRLVTAIATTTLILPAKTTTNSSISETFCTLQQAIDFQATLPGNIITANAGTYDEQVVINKGITIDGIDSSNRVATFSGVAPATAVKGIFIITAQNVTIKNFKFIVDLAKTHSAIVTSGNASNLLITGNTIIADNPSGGALLSYGLRNGININISSTTNASQANPITNITIQSNTIDSRNNMTFRAALGADQSSGLLVGGNNSNDGNKFLASVNHDVLIRNYYGDQTVKNNLFKGGGVEVSASSGNGAVIVSNNIFDGTYAHTIASAMARLFTNTWLNRTINFSYNQFINQKWAISFENSRNVILDHNDITATYNNFRLISINTKLRQTGSPTTLETIDIKLTNNNLNAVAGLVSGVALEFLNFDQRPANNYLNGNFVIGEAGNENDFNANIPSFVKVSNLNGMNTLTQAFLDLYPEYASTQYVSTTGYWTRDIFARHNRFFVNGNLKLASDFSAEDFNAVYTSIFDRQDDINVGAVVLMPTWSGATSTDWSDSTNWSYKFVPVAGLDAVIYPQVNKPVLTTDAACDTLILSSGMTLTTGTHTLTLFGNVRSTGIVDATTGSIILAGSLNQLLSGSINVKNLTLSNFAGARIEAGDSNKIMLSGIYTPTNGTLTTNNNLVLKSDSAGTASVSRGCSNGSYISGKVTVERYLSAHKSWRLLSIPSNTTQTVRQTWQEGATSNTSNPVANHGMQITGAGGTAAGFDLYTSAPSMKSYNSATDTWVGIPNTTSASINTTSGYMVFVRGDRTANGAFSTPTPTTLRIDGPLYTGDLAPIPVAANKFAVIGNPYASAVDMRSISKTGIKDFFYIWDSNLGGASGFGGYQTFSNLGDGNYEAIPGMGSYGAYGNVYNYIESGQAFFVQADEAGGNVTFKEEAKASEHRQVASVAAISQSKLRTSLYGINADNSAYIADGFFVNFGDNYSNAIDNMDGLKSANSAENMSIKTAKTLLVIERRHSIVTSDTIFLNLTGVKIQKYRFEFTADQLGQQGITGFLEDAYLHTSTPLNLNGTTVVDFNIINIPASYAANRFRIVFTPPMVLPLTFTSIKAFTRSSDIMVDWQAANESNLKKYDVEKSVDGKNFIPVYTIAANNKALSNYNWIDAQPLEGNNYYRILSTDLNGKTEYSKIVKVYTGKEKPGISIYPNPVSISSGVINLQFTNEASGVYSIKLLNKLGQVIITKKIPVTNNTVETISLNGNISSGIYQMEISKPGGDKTNISVSVIK